MPTVALPVEACADNPPAAPAEDIVVTVGLTLFNETRVVPVRWE